MTHENGHWCWWHWLLIIIITIVILGITYTIVHNYEIVKDNNKTVTNSTREIIEHPINSTENMIKDVTK